MKATYTFEPDDFKGAGQLLTHLPVNSKTTMEGSYCCKVGYRRVDGCNAHSLISMADGAIYGEHSNVEEFCEYLNTQKGTSLRPLTELECKQLGESLHNRFPKNPT